MTSPTLSSVKSEIRTLIDTIQRDAPDMDHALADIEFRFEDIAMLDDPRMALAAALALYDTVVTLRRRQVALKRRRQRAFAARLLLTIGALACLPILYMIANRLPWPADWIGGFLFVIGLTAAALYFDRVISKHFGV